MLSQPSVLPPRSQQAGAAPAAHSQRDFPAVAPRAPAPRRRPLSQALQQSRPEARPAPMSNHILLKPSASNGHDAETSDYRIQAPNVGAMEVRTGSGGAGLVLVWCSLLAPCTPLDEQECCSRHAWCGSAGCACPPHPCHPGWRLLRPAPMHMHGVLAPHACHSGQRRARPDCSRRAHLPSLQLPDELKRDCLLFYYPDCEQLARRVAECSEGKVELAEITWK